MIFLKYIILCLIFASSFFIGIIFSNKFKNRVTELRNIREYINILQTKIRYTYEPIKEIFEELSNIPNNVSYIFKLANEKMKEKDVKTSWEEAVDCSKSNLSLNKEDINIIKGIGKFLRKN